MGRGARRDSRTSVGILAPASLGRDSYLAPPCAAGFLSPTVTGKDSRGGGWENWLVPLLVEKPRTVIGDFAGGEIPGPWSEAIARVRGCLAMSDDSTAALRRLLTPAEVEALTARCSDMIAGPVLPEMYAWRCVPWPLI